MSLSGLLLLEPRVFGDQRGFFFESFNQRAFNEAVGYQVDFVQDNHSASEQSVLRGMHYQLGKPQGKLVRVVLGEVFDVVVDIRPQSPTFGRCEGVVLSAENKLQLWVPPGFAHGFLTLSERAEFLYKTTDYYYPECERCIMWNDADLAIQWPLSSVPILSAKDLAGKCWREAAAELKK